MPIRKITVKIENGKVVFSDEILNYFESIRTKENSVWIDKYFEVLKDESNLSTTKFNLHHIRPCFTFKDKEHKNRKDSQILADEFKENIIKISTYNHILAHYYLWKIYNEWNSKKAIESMCGQEKYIENLTEDELKEIARLKEECAKENQTREEKAKYHKEWYEENKENELERVNKWTENNQDRVKRNKDDWYQRNKERISKEHKERRAEICEVERAYRHNNKDKVKARRDRPCYDPIRKDICTWNALKHRKSRNAELYKNISLPNCLIKSETNA